MFSKISDNLSRICVSVFGIRYLPLFFSKMLLCNRNRELLDFRCPDSLCSAFFKHIRETAYAIEEATHRYVTLILSADSSCHPCPEWCANRISKGLVSSRVCNLFLLALSVDIVIIDLTAFVFFRLPDQSPVIWKSLKSFALKSERCKSPYSRAYIIHFITTFLTIRSLLMRPPPHN